MFCDYAAAHLLMAQAGQSLPHAQEVHEVEEPGLLTGAVTATCIILSFLGAAGAGSLLG